MKQKKRFPKIKFDTLYHYNDLPKFAKDEILKAFSKSPKVLPLTEQTLKEVNPTYILQLKLSGGFMDYLLLEKFKQLKHEANGRLLKM